MYHFVPRHALAWWQQVLIAIGATGGAWLARLALAAALQDQGPYPLFFVSVLVTGLFCGWELSILATIAGGVIANVSFVPPYGHFVLNGKYGWGFALYFATAIAIVWLARSIAEAFHRESAVAERLSTVSDEYRHRIKNLLAMVHALTSQTARHANSVAEFQGKIMDRLDALFRAQDILSNPSEVGVPLHRLVTQVLEPFAQEGQVIMGSSDEISISSDKAISLAMILNELATNALKYGALSSPSGRVLLHWRTENAWLVIQWQERDGPPVVAPKKRGFGSRLFDQALPRASGTIKLAFDPEGLRCDMKLIPGALA